MIAAIYARKLTDQIEASEDGATEGWTIDGVGAHSANVPAFSQYS